MKIVHSADWHIDQLHDWGKKASFNEYHLQKLDILFQQTINMKADVFIFAGDLYKNSSSNFKTKDKINDYLLQKINELRKKGILVIMISWNHDIRHKSTVNKDNNLKLYNTVSYEDLIVNDPNSESIIYKDYKGVRFILWPYLRNRLKGDIKDEIKALIKEFNGDSIIVGHLDVFGALYGSIEIKSLDLEDLNTWSPDELESLWAQLVLLGHVHNHQTLGEEKRIIYSGSPYKLSYNEEGVQKWYYVHTKEKGYWNSSFLDLYDKKWKTFRYDYEEKKNFQDLLEEIKREELEGAVVRIIIEKINAEAYKYIPYKEIQDILTDKNIFLFRGFSYKELRKTVEKNQQIENLWEELTDEKLNPKNILESVLNKEGLEKEEIESNLIVLDQLVTTLELNQ